MRAPVVVAKGKDLIAQQIRKIALSHEVPILSAPPLSRALYFSTELQQEIPSGLYMAVAQVLAYVYQLRQTRRGNSNESIAMQDIPIPDEFRHD
jgi:flagellar biosynthetic protein FlhB